MQKKELSCEHHTELESEDHLTKDKLKSMPKWHIVEKEIVLMGSFHSLNFISVFNCLCKGAIEGGIHVAKSHDGFQGRKTTKPSRRWQRRKREN